MAAVTSSPRKLPGFHGLHLMYGAQVFVSESPKGDIRELTSSSVAGNADGSIGGVPKSDQEACLKAVSDQTNNSVKVLAAVSSEASNSVTVGVGPEEAKWECLVKNGRVANVMSLSN